MADASEFGNDKAYGIFLYYPSPDGRYVAFCLSKGSVYRCVLYLAEVETGKVFQESTDINWVVRGTWAPDSSGFYVPVPHPRNFMEWQIFFQEVGKAKREGPEDVRIVISPGPIAISSDDDRFIGIMDGLFERRLTHLKDLSTGVWAEFLPPGYEGGLAGHFRGEEYIALSVTDQFPRGRVVRIPIATSTDISTWKELVPESDRALQSVSVLGEKLLTTELLDTYTTIRAFELEGNEVGEVPFPYPGNAVVARGRGPALASGTEGEEAEGSSKLTLHHTTPISSGDLPIRLRHQGARVVGRDQEGGWPEFSPSSRVGKLALRNSIPSADDTDLITTSTH